GGGGFIASSVSSSFLSNSTFLSNRALVGGASLFFGIANSNRTNFSDVILSSLCALAPPPIANNSQPYGNISFSSPPLSLTIISSPDNQSTWNNNAFHVSLQLIDMCDQPMLLDQVFVTTNSSSDAFSLPYGVNVEK